MDSSKPLYNWREILHEMCSNIQNEIALLLPEMGKHMVPEFKNLLDESAQKAVIETIKSHRISARLVSEEGDKNFGSGDYYIVADPVDGTTNLARGLPPAVTSILVSDKPQLSGAVAGIIQNFFTGSTYYSEHGKGATLNGELVHVGGHPDFETALISMDISKNPCLEKTKRILEESRHIRQLGCSAMSLCHVSSGVVDAHIDVRGILRATDCVAGLLLVREAGGNYAINGVVGGDLQLTRDTRLELVATSTYSLMDEILRLLGY
jgi:myo-inositol-1(or 4)-monophosphatase